MAGPPPLNDLVTRPYRAFLTYCEVTLRCVIVGVGKIVFHFNDAASEATATPTAQFLGSTHSVSAFGDAAFLYRQIHGSGLIQLCFQRCEISMRYELSHCLLPIGSTFRRL